jgi:hypothetical protein
MIPENSFSSEGILKIEFPMEIYVIDGAYLGDVSDNMSTGIIYVDFNQDVRIE